MSSKTAQRILLHFPLCPFSRKVRLSLGEKKLSYQPIIELIWKKRSEFLDLNPAGQVPVFIDADNSKIIDSTAICEYLEEVYPSSPFLGRTPLASAEIRRLVGWFDQKFYQEVTKVLLFEKLFKRHRGQGGPDSQLIRQSIVSLAEHIEYVTWLLEHRHGLAGETFSLADIVASAHLSVVDFLGHMSWDRSTVLKEWYARVKSRPSFRPLLYDHIPGMSPPSHYADLDF